MEDNKSVEGVSAETPKVETPATTEVGEAETRIAELEAEKLKVTEEAANWKMAALKARSKARDNFKENLDDESEEERISRIVQEKLAQTKIAQIDTEKENLLKKLAKENKELRLAYLNKNKEPSATLGTHSESQAVQDTSITPDQMKAFKAKGWTEKDIERYKKNLGRYGK